MKAGLSKAARPRPASPTSSSTAAHTAEPEISAQVFWPSECLAPPLSGASSCGYWVVGWNVHKFTFCVAALVPQTQCPHIEDVEGVLGEMWRDVWLGGVYSYCNNQTSAHTPGQEAGPGAAVMVLGECVYTTTDDAQAPGGHSESGAKVWRWGHVRAPPPIWLHLSCTLPTPHSTHTPQSPVLQLLSLHCCGCPYRCVPCTLVLYDRCLYEHGHFLLPPSLPSPPKPLDRGGGKRAKPREDKRGEDEGTPSSGGSSGCSFDVTLHHINSAHIIHTQLQRRLSSPLPSSPSPRPPPPRCAVPRCLLQAALTLHHSTAQLLSVLVGPECRPSPRLRLSSLACAHLLSRLRRVQALPQHARLLFHHRARHTSAQGLSAPTLTLQGRVWGVWADVVVGGCLGLLLTWHADDALHLLHTLAQPLHVKWLSGQVEWLKQYPGGFKLNTPLTQRLGTLVVTVLECHGAVLSLLLPPPLHKPGLHALAALGLLGASSQLAALVDVLRVLTWHTDVALAVLARLYYLELSLLGSLWRLFRGKKWNVLRHRIDSLSPEYVSTPQLLLGSMLGTVLTCLFPTMALFYAFFAALQCCVLLVQWMVWLGFLLLRDLPFHRAYLLVCDPRRLPGPVTLSLLHLPSPSSDDPLSSSSSSHSHSHSHLSRPSSDDPASLDDSDTSPPDAPLHSGSEDLCVSPVRRPSHPPPHTTHRRGSALLRLQGGRQGLASLLTEYAHSLTCLANTINTTPGRVLGAVLTGALVADPHKGGQVWLLQRKSLAQVLTEVSVLSAAQQDERDRQALHRLGPLLPHPTPHQDAAASAMATGVDLLVLALALLLVLAWGALLLGVTTVYRTHQLQHIDANATAGYFNAASIEL